MNSILFFNTTRTRVPESSKKSASPQLPNQVEPVPTKDARLMAIFICTTFSFVQELTADALRSRPTGRILASMSNAIHSAFSSTPDLAIVEKSFCPEELPIISFVELLPWLPENAKSAAMAALLQMVANLFHKQPTNPARHKIKLPLFKMKLRYTRGS